MRMRSYRIGACAFVSELSVAVLISFPIERTSDSISYGIDVPTIVIFGDPDAGCPITDKVNFQREAVFCHENTFKIPSIDP